MSGEKRERISLRRWTVRVFPIPWQFQLKQAKEEILEVTENPSPYECWLEKL